MTLEDFVQQHQPKNYGPLPWHARQLCRVIERGMRERKHVIAEQPPRHWKSEIINVYRPAWWIAEGNVRNHCAVVCNSQQLAEKFCQATSRMVPLEKSVDRNGEWKLSADTDSLDLTYKASGIGGQLTGWGFSDVVFDDLFKNGKEAKSQTVRESIIDGVVSAAMNRLTPDGIAIAMQARLHPGDTIGWLLSTDMKFLRLHLPATNDDGQGAWFEDGYSGEHVTFPAYDALWPERFPRPVLEAIFDRITPYYKQAQFMQVPKLGDLNFFDVSMCPRYTSIGRILNLWVAVDAAQTKTETGAYTCFVCLANCLDDTGHKHIKVLGVRRFRGRPDEMKQELIDFYQGITRRHGCYPEAVVIERAAGGYALLDIQGMPTIPIDPKGDKEERAGSVCWLVNKGVVQLPQEAPWLEAFVDELENFPLTNYKDQVDAFTHALAWELRKAQDFDMKHLQRILTPGTGGGGFSPNSVEGRLAALGLDVADLEWEQRLGGGEGFPGDNVGANEILNRRDW
jgi:predicted phage terminase large subunit-like protein